MGFVVEFDPNAEAELIKAIECYEEQQTGLGSRFEEEVEHKVELIAKSPFAFANKRANVRECLVEDFPYLLVYKTFADRNLFISRLSSIPAEIREKNT